MSFQQATVIPLDSEPDGMDTDDGSRKVTFSGVVSVVAIPTRDSYTLEERETLWMPTHDLQQQRQRNLLEFAAEGWFWENVVEEEGMEVVDGRFVHPIHLNPMLKEALQRQIPYPRAVTPPDEDLLFCVAPIKAPQDPIDRPSSPFVRTVFDQDYSSDEDDMLLIDPDAYLIRRFAHHNHRHHHHCKRRDDIQFGDSDDAFFTQMFHSGHRTRREDSFP